MRLPPRYPYVLHKISDDARAVGATDKTGGLGRKYKVERQKEEVSQGGAAEHPFAFLPLPSYLCRGMTSMLRYLTLSNGRLLVNFDREYRLRDLSWPRVGQENHTEGDPFRFGVHCDDQFSWTAQRPDGAADPPLHG